MSRIATWFKCCGGGAYPHYALFILALFSAFRINRWILFLLVLLFPTTQAAIASECAATSGTQRVVLIELYTSEGCSSCPPADRWLSTLASRFPAERVIPLALHVDYWDYIGWKDRFAQPVFSARQREMVQASGGRVVYTPQFMLNGRDFAARRTDALARELAQVSRLPPMAEISLSLAVSPASLEVTASAKASPGAELYLAVYQNELSSAVLAGENRGVRLQHDYVVREWRGPIKPGMRSVQIFPFKADWSAAKMGVAAFVQNQSTGEIMQALRLPFCAG